MVRGRVPKNGQNLDRGHSHVISEVFLQIKQVLEKKENIPRTSQPLLLHDGKTLDDEQTLLQAGVSNGTSLFMLIGPRGMTCKLEGIHEGVDAR